MKRLMLVLWPSFLAAGIAEILFFTVIDPEHLYFLGREVEFGALATYSLGFLFFWLITSAASAFTLLLHE